MALKSQILIYFTTHNAVIKTNYALDSCQGAKGSHEKESPFIIPKSVVRGFYLTCEGVVE